jgi:hypothetical protein
MGKTINVKLSGISCKSNGFGGSAQISGNVFGETFQDDPNNPGDLRDSRIIYPFPSGPISVAEGQQVNIVMKNSISFTLSTGPVFEPESLHPKFLKITGDLNNGLGSTFLLLFKTDQFPVFPEEPQKRDLVFNSANLDIVLTFDLTMQNPF